MEDRKHIKLTSKKKNLQITVSYREMEDIRVSDPYSFFTDPDPDPLDPDGGQYGSGYGSGSNPDPGL
jgi:hypothetical protein